MGLRDLQTSLKSVPYGKDRLGGGNSEQPYVTTPIIEKEATLNFFRFNPDFPIRGGLLSAIRTAKDLERIGKFLADPSKGPLFISKQIGLQLTNPKIETGKNGILENTRIYNGGANTLAQIAGGAIGTHVERHGLILDDYKSKYEYIVSNKTKDENRLVTLYGTKILSDNNYYSNAQKMGISLNYDEIFNYVGGPGSFLGIGKTTIKKANTRYNSTYINNKQINGLYTGSFATDFKHERSDKSKNPINYVNAINLSKSKGYYNGIDYNNPTKTPSQFEQSGIDFISRIDERLRTQRGNEVGIFTFTKSLISKSEPWQNKNTSEVQDFRYTLQQSGSISGMDIPNFNYKYKLIKRQTRVLTGDPGLRGATRIKYWEGTKNQGTQDRINMLPLYEGSSPLPVEYTRDLVKFRFEVINNDPPENVVFIHFRAFLSSISDNYSPEWSDFKYLGRGESFHTYQGFKRNISFSFKAHAQSREEMKPMYQKLNYLASSMMPDYNEQKFMRGNIIKLTLGDYIYSQPGIITSLNYKINDNVSWEIAMQEPEKNVDNDMHELPHLIEVDVNFTPIHNFLPRKTATTPIITPYSNEGNAFIWDKANNNPKIIHPKSDFTGGSGQDLNKLMKK